MFAKKTLLAAVAVGLVSLPGAAMAQGINELAQLMSVVTDGANVAGSAIAINSLNSPFSPSASGLSYDVDPDTCGLSPWSRANAETFKLRVGPIDGNVTFATGIAGIDYACTNVGGKGLDISGGVYAGGSKGVVTNVQFPTVKFDVSQWLVGAYTQFSQGNFAGNIKIQQSNEQYVGTGFVGAGFPVGAVPEGSTLTLDRTAVSGAASYTYEIMDNTFLIPIVGFDVAQLNPKPIQFGNGIAFVPATSTSALVYGGLTLAHSFILPDGTSAFVPFVSGTYYADVGNGVAGALTDGVGTVALNGNADLSYWEVGAGFNYLTILDDGSGDAQLKQVTAGVRGFYKWNSIMTGYGAAASVRLAF